MRSQLLASVPPSLNMWAGNDFGEGAFNTVQPRSLSSAQRLLLSSNYADFPHLSLSFLSSHACISYPTMDRVPSNNFKRKVPQRSQSSSTSQSTPPSSSRSLRSKPSLDTPPSSEHSLRSRSSLAAQARQANQLTIGAAGTDHISNRKNTIATPYKIDDEFESPEGRKRIPSRSRRRTIPDDEDDDIMAPIADLGADTARIQEKTPDPTSPTAEASVVEKSSAECSSGVPSSGVLGCVAGAEDQNARRPLPRPRFVYYIPDDLKGVCQALGKDTWNEYLSLVERKEMGKLTETAFARKTNPLFMTFDTATRRRIDKKIMELVAPVVEDHLAPSLQPPIESEFV